MFPILYATPWFNVYAYGTLMALGYALGTFVILWETRREGLDVESVFDMLLLQMLVGIIGARLLFMLEFDGLNNPRFSFWNFESGGLSFYGAVVSSLLFDLLFLKFKGMPFWRVMDCVGMGLPLGAALARMGCFLNGCCAGTSCAWPWGVKFPGANPEFVHPTQLYESLACFLIFLLLRRYVAKRRWYGQIFLGYIGLYAAFRFTVEFWRADNPHQVMGLTMAHLISLGALVFVAVVWRLLGRDISLRVPPRPSPPMGLPEIQDPS